MDQLAAASEYASHTAAALPTEPLTIPRALEIAVALAERGPAWDINPRVGCVLLQPAPTAGLYQIIGQGWHKGSGTAHAEVAALQDATQHGHDTTGAVAVVTLEPCAHTGQTGPCSTALRQAQISTLYYGESDPGNTSGGGARQLNGHGVHTHQVASPATAQLIATWLYRRQLSRPYVIAKIAMTLDGLVAAADGSSQWITAAESRADAHLVRSQMDAILVGTGTVVADDPSLTARTASGEVLANQPAVYALGVRDLSPEAKVFRHPTSFTQLRTHDPAAAVSALKEAQHRTVLVEGGPTVVTAFLRAGLVDECHIYVAPKFLGEGTRAVQSLGITTLAESLNGRFDPPRQLGGDILIRWHRSPLQNQPNSQTQDEE